jgi:hypothetical protein
MTEWWPCSCQAVAGPRDNQRIHLQRMHLCAIDERGWTAVERGRGFSSTRRDRSENRTGATLPRPRLVVDVPGAFPDCRAAGRRIILRSAHFAHFGSLAPRLGFIYATTLCVAAEFAFIGYLSSTAYGGAVMVESVVRLACPPAGPARCARPGGRARAGRPSGRGGR